MEWRGKKQREEEKFGGVGCKKSKTNKKSRRNNWNEKKEHEWLTGKL